MLPRQESEQSGFAGESSGFLVTQILAISMATSRGRRGRMTGEKLVSAAVVTKERFPSAFNARRPIHRRFMPVAAHGE